MNRIPPLRLPSLSAEVLTSGVILEPKKGELLSLEDCKELNAWLHTLMADEYCICPQSFPSHMGHVNGCNAIQVEDVPTGKQDHGFELYP